MKDKIEDIRKKCIEANPSILDLKFGCGFKVDGKKYKILNTATPITWSIVVNDVKKIKYFYVCKVV